MTSDASTHIRDLKGNIVGLIEKPLSGPLKVKLDEPWAFIAEAINRDIEAGRHLVGPMWEAQRVTGSTAADMEVVIRTIQVLSERRLQVDLATARTA